MGVMRRKMMWETAVRKDRSGHRPWSVRLCWVSFILLALLLSGCGYSFSGMSKAAYPTIQSVYVDVFTNKTSEPNLDVIFRSAFGNEIVSNGHFKLASSRGEADAILRGTLLSMQVSPLAYKTGSLSAEDRITVAMELFFEGRVSGRILWTNGNFVGTGDYRISGIGATEVARRAAFTKLAGDSAEKAYRLMMSDF
jgi:hypothetical protein